MLLTSPRLRLKIVSALAALAFTSACTSTTLINTRPSGAHIEVDGRYIGESPASWSETVTATTRNHVNYSLAGYKPGVGSIAADQWTGSKVAGSVILGLTCLPLIGFVGLIWSTDYKPSYEFLLEPDAGGVPGYGTPVAPGSQPMQPVQPNNSFGPAPAPQPQYQPNATPNYQPQPMQPAPANPGSFGPPANPTPPPPPPPLRTFDPDGLRRNR